MNTTITAVPGITVGHANDPLRLTGCTVVLAREGATGGCAQRGGAPGTRETDVLRPSNHVQQVHAVVLAGGSAFGLAAADGVMRYLAAEGIGFRVGPVVVPIVTAAVLFDLALPGAGNTPDAAMGYEAASSASSAPVVLGNVGAGTGCTAGKVKGIAWATKTGIGSASLQIAGAVRGRSDNLVVGALVALNPFGEVVDEAGRVIAGPRDPDGGFIPTLDWIRARPRPSTTFASPATVLAVVATNARLTKDEATRVAEMADDGLARRVHPSHTPVDGDTVFALATGQVQADPLLVGACAAEMVSAAIIGAVRLAVGAAGLPSAADLK